MCEKYMYGTSKVDVGPSRIMIEIMIVFVSLLGVFSIQSIKVLRYKLRAKN